MRVSRSDNTGQLTVNGATRSEEANARCEQKRGLSWTGMRARWVNACVVWECGRAQWGKEASCLSSALLYIDVEGCAKKRQCLGTTVVCKL